MGEGGGEGSGGLYLLALLQSFLLFLPKVTGGLGPLLDPSLMQHFIFPVRQRIP